MIGSIAAGTIALTGATIYFNIDKLNAYMLENFIGKINKDCRQEKTILFESLNQLAKEAGPKKLKVLEIGGGTGANFEFIQESIDWTTIDPNEHCLKYYNAKVEELGDKHTFGGVINVSKYNASHLFLRGSLHLFMLR